MKKMNKIKLTTLTHNEIVDKEQRLLKGGGDYKCGCVSYCLDYLCVCFDEGGTMAKDVSLYSISSLPSKEEHIDDMTDTNYQKN